MASTHNKPAYWATFIGLGLGNVGADLFMHTNKAVEHSLFQAIAIFAVWLSAKLKW